MHLYQRLCCNKRETAPKSRLIPLFTHPYLPAIAGATTLGVLELTNPGAAALLAFCCQYLFFTLTPWLLKTFPQTFTLGEATVVGQALALTVSLSGKGFVSGLCSSQKFNEEKKAELFLQTAVLALTGMSAILFCFKTIRHPKFFYPLLIIFASLGVGMSSIVIRTWSLIWLFDYFTKSQMRLIIVGGSSVLALIGILFTAWARRYRDTPTTVIRKLYHVIVVCIFTPGILLDSPFTFFISTAAMMLCIFLEVIRVNGITPFASPISDAFSFFLDEKDRGSLILSHLYLLAGVATPLWLSPCPLSEATPRTALPLLAGVLSVGIGDTAASIGGTYLGKHKWAGTKRTVEGSICGIIAQLCLVVPLGMLGHVELSSLLLTRVIISTTLTAVVEAFLEQVDNIVLPLLLYTPLMDP
ncbi:dolichol kinase isoform X2 [Oratosquilla oratoria]